MDNNVYYKAENGRYKPFGCRYDEKYLPDGIYYIYHSPNMSGSTNVDHYLSGICKVGESKIPNYPEICGIHDICNEILYSDAFKEIEANGSFTWFDIVHKIVSLSLEISRREYDKKATDRVSKDTTR